MRNPSGYWAIGLWLVAILALAGASRAADLHFIFMADTLDPDIGTGVDLQRANTWAQTIAGYSGLTLRFQSLSGELFTATRARNMLRAVNPGPDDVVYFTYSGHGANPGDSKWPMFALLTDTHFDFDEVVAILQPKQQRLLIVLADCCNVVMSAGRSAPEFDPSAQTALTAVNFQNLFLKFRGTVLASASSKGQYSLGDSAEGGLFLNAFMDDFRQMAGAVENLTWQDLLATTSADTQQLAAGYGETQVPQFAVNTEQVASEAPPPPSSDTPPSSDDTTAPPDDSSSSDDGTNQTPASNGEDLAREDGEPVAAPMCGPMATLPLAISACLWAMRRRK